MTQKYIIAVDIQTTAPLHITALEKGGYDVEGRRIMRYDAPNTIGASLTRTMSIADAAFIKEDGKAFVPLVPVIPASTVGGKLRRAAADLLYASMVARDLTVSPDCYNVLNSGMATTKIEADQADSETEVTQRQDPFLAIFGGTSFMLPAYSVIAEGWPLVEHTRNKLMTEPMAPVSVLTDYRDMTDAVAIIRKNDAADLAGQFVEGVVGIKALAEYAEAQQAERSASRAKKSTGESGTKTDLRTFNAIEVVRAGMGFALRVELSARTPAHLGFLLMAMQRMLQEGQFGGKGARGMGAYIATASRIYAIDPSNRTTSVISAIYGDKISGYAFLDHPIINSAVMAAQDYIDEADPAFYELFASADAKGLKARFRAAQKVRNGLAAEIAEAV